MRQAGEAYKKTSRGAKIQKSMDYQDIIDVAMDLSPVESHRSVLPPLPDAYDPELMPDARSARKSLLPLFEKAHKLGQGKKMKGTKRSKATKKNPYNRWSRKTPRARKPASRSVGVGAPRVHINTLSQRNAYSVRENVRGMLYPHANTKPRFMDGAVAESQTHYSKTISELIIPAGKTAVVLLYPNCTSYLIYKPDQSVSSYNVAIGDVDEIGIDISAIAAASGQMAKNGTVDRWRTVSLGMKLSLLNATNQNDGWFEAYRVTTTPRVEDVYVTETTGGSNKAFLTAKPAYVDTVYGYRTASQSRSSYIADSLKCIDKYYFKLNPYAEEHPFIDIHGKFAIGSTGLYAAGPPKQWQPNGSDTRSYRPLLDSFMDPTFDAVCVVIHGGAAGSNVLIDCARNLEVVYENSSTLARFHEQTIKDDRAHKLAHGSMTSDTKAGISLSAS